MSSSATGASTNNGPPQAIRQRSALLAAQKRQAEADKNRVNSTRAAGAGGSSNTMMRLYTADDSPGLRVDPVVILTLAVVFIFSVISLHLLAKASKYFFKG